MTREKLKQELLEYFKTASYQGDYVKQYMECVVDFIMWRDGRKIGFNREKLAKKLFEMRFEALTWKEGWMHHEEYLKKANALIANEAEIIEVKE